MGSAVRTVRVVIAFSLLFTMVAAGSAAVPAAGAERSSYIVVFEDNVANVEATARQLTQGAGGELGFVYQHALKGFSANLTAQAASALARNPNVAYVEADQLVHVTDHTSPPVPTGIDRINADQNHALAFNGVDDKRVDAVVAVIDTGIQFTHPDLNVDTVNSVNCSGGSPFQGSCTKGAGNDDNGHGTHVAGTIGALDDGANVNGTHVVGVAPGATLWSVKVLRSDGSGYMTWIIAGIDYVTANADKVDVANMSLGCECSFAALDTAITNSVAAGVTYVTSAGNSSKDAATFIPANHPDVITVSALADFNGEPGGGAAPTCRQDTDDTLANFSNFGQVVDVIAPGVCILSTWTNSGYNVISGTSMSSPHVAGAAALLASSTDMTPVQIKAHLIATGALDWNGDKDTFKEPRIDVAGFSVVFVDGSGEGGGGGDPDDPGDPDEPGDPGDDTPALSGSSSNNGSTWTATVTLTGSVGDSTSGTWDYNNAPGSCTIGSGQSTCSVSLSGIPKRVSSVTYTDGAFGSVVVSK
jgi:subtilisin